MNERLSPFHGLIVAGVFALFAVVPTAAQSDTVGSAAAVKPASTGTPPGGSSRTIQVGTKIVSNERINTSQGGSLQVMFVDKSTLSIGPNSDITIDKFVFNPGSGSGAFGVKLAKGALRFVGGQISHTTGATITTPVATMGIRGGVGFASHDAICQEIQNKKKSRRQQCSKFVCISGKCTVTSSSDSRSFRLRLNEALEIGSLGGAQTFNVNSVTLNHLFKGGDGAITVGTKPQNNAVTFDGKDTLDKTISEQAPEPIPLPLGPSSPIP